LRDNWRRPYDPSLGRATQADPLAIGGLIIAGGYIWEKYCNPLFKNFGGGNEEERCKQIIEACRVKCADIFAENPDDLPGTGHDYSGRMRRCIRECAAAQGCDF
jgi:hypothetical protein